MTFRSNNPMHEGAPPAGGMEFPQRTGSAPAFRPQIVRSVRLHPLLAAGVAAVVLVALVGFALREKMVYQASSQVYEEPATAKLLSTSSDAFDANKYDTFLNEQMQLVQRPDVVAGGLATLPRTTWQEFGATPEQAADAIQTALKVQRIATSYQISIGLKGSDAADTAAIVNAITTAYLDTVHKASAAETDQRATLLAEERERVERELQAARAEQTALGASIGVASPTGETGNPYDADLSGVRTQLTEARAAHDVAAAQLATLSGIGASHASGLTAAADELIAGDSGLSTMKSAISEKRAALTSQMSGMKPSNPVYQQDQEELADLDRTLDTATNELRAKAARRLQDKLRSDLERTGEIEARLNGELARQIQSATSAAPKLQRAGEVAADLQRLNLREAAVDDALRSLRMDANAPEQVRLSLPATVPTHPEANRRKLLLMAALPLALLCGAFAAVLARKQDKKIYSGIDIDEVLGFQPLAILPARGDVPERVFEEYVLRLAAGVESAYRTNGARTFLLTAVSLTTDIAPLTTALTRKFEEIGVNAMVATASEMLTPTDDNDAPASYRTPGELARSAALYWSEGFVAANLARLKAEHGLVLIESQALLNCAQTEYVARCADATILMVECGVTTRQELLQAAELLQRLNVTGIGAVLEELQLRFADAAFRKAIEALEKRQAETAPMPMRPMMRAAEVSPVEEFKTVVEPEAAVAEPEIAVPEPEVMFAEPETVDAEPEGIVAEPAMVVPEPEVMFAEPEVAVAEPEVAFAEPEVVVAEAEPAPEVAVAAAAVEEPAEVVEALPAMPVVEEIPQEVRSAVVPAVAVGPMLVDTPPVPMWTAEENIVPERVIAVANGTFREKISPTLSARRDESASGGDARMTRNISWLDRLLRRNPEPVFRIVPDRPASLNTEEYDSDDEETGQTPSIAAHAAKQAEDYDLPLVNRLDQISRSRQAAPASATSSSGRPARLQIVPNESHSPAPEALLTGLFHAPGIQDAFGEAPTAEFRIPAPPPPPPPMPPPMPVAAMPIAVEAEPAPSMWEPVAAAWEPESILPAPTPETVEIPEPVAVLAPISAPEPVAIPEPEPEPMFEPVAFVLQTPQTLQTPVEFVPELAPEPVVEVAQATPEVVEEIAVLPPAPVSRPRRPLSFHELAGQMSAAPAALPEPVAEPVPAPVVAEPVVVEAAAAVPEIVPEPVSVPEPEPEPIATPAIFEVAAAPPVEVATPVQVAPPVVEEPWTEPVAEAPSADLDEPSYATPQYAREFVPEPIYPAPSFPASSYTAPAYAAAAYTAASQPEPEPQPLAQEESEPYDIEPVYREASRNLTTGRWDPIPPLRPSSNGWRDRPSPIPATNRAALPERGRWTGTEDDGAASPPNRWASAPQPVPTEPAAEPLLTRQWGLLSRFQQARISSSRPVAKTPDEEQPFANRDRQR